MTLEDIIEEIVGDIDDEHDVELAGCTAQADGSYVVDGNVTIRDLNRILDINLPDSDASTIAGLLLYETRTIPLQEESLIFMECAFALFIDKITKLQVLEYGRNKNMLAKKIIFYVIRIKNSA